MNQNGKNLSRKKQQNHMGLVSEDCNPYIFLQSSETRPIWFCCFFRDKFFPFWFIQKCSI